MRKMTDQAIQKSAMELADQVYSFSLMLSDWMAENNGAVQNSGEYE